MTRQNKLSNRSLIMSILALILIALMLHHCHNRHQFPDFTQYQTTQAKKKAFFDYMATLDAQANQAVINDRERAIMLFKLDKLKYSQRHWLTNLAEKYQLTDWNINSPADRALLLKRVDEVPTPLLLAQAADESAWGTSRFAVKGNNLFGLWCFTKGCGMVPNRRNKGATHEVMTFKYPLDAVTYYIFTLNTNNNYQAFRTIRAKMRADHQPLDSYKLVEGLANYSAKGQGYIDHIQNMIRRNDLEKRYP